MIAGAEPLERLEEVARDSARTPRTSGARTGGRTPAGGAPRSWSRRDTRGSRRRAAARPWRRAITSRPLGSVVLVKRKSGSRRAGSWDGGRSQEEIGGRFGSQTHDTRSSTECMPIGRPADRRAPMARPIAIGGSCRAGRFPLPGGRGSDTMRLDRANPWSRCAQGRIAWPAATSGDRREGPRVARRSRRDLGRSRRRPVAAAAESAPRRTDEREQGRAVNWDDIIIDAAATDTGHAALE